MKIELAESHDFKGCDSYFRIIQEGQKQSQKHKSICLTARYTLYLVNTRQEGSSKTSHHEVAHRLISNRV